MAKPRKALRNQRPRKRKQLFQIKFIGFGAILLASIGLSWYALRSFDFESTTQRTQPPPIKWDLQITGERLSSKRMKELHQAVTEACPNGHPEELEFTAQLLQTKLEVDRVRLVRTGHQQMHLFIKPRKPYLRIFTGKERLLSASGQIYGMATANHGTLPLLKGIPMENATWRTDGTLQVAKESEQLIEQAIELVKLARTHRVDIIELVYIPYRGFAFTRAGDHLEAVVGYRPFEDKLDRLVKLIGSLKKKGSHVERIELDYQGKAFIKEKKS